MQVLQQRLPQLKMRFDLIGAVSVFGDDAGSALAQTDPVRVAQATDVRLRAACAHADKSTAAMLLREVNALYTCGPAGGGGVRTHLRSRLNAVSCVLERTAVTTGFSFVE
jgi:hypothetical protein